MAENEPLPDSDSGSTVNFTDDEAESAEDFSDSGSTVNFTDDDEAKS